MFAYWGFIHLGPEWSAMFIKRDLLNTADQRIASSNPGTDSSNFASPLRKELVLLLAEYTLDIISDVVIPQ